MHGWRICRKQHLSNALEGIGAEKAGGRWNKRGSRIVYTSSSLSLASLELFVNLDTDILPINLVSLRIEIPDTVSREEVSITQLPRNWRTYPAPPKLQELGSQWLEEERSLLLIVPSAVTPEEPNILINPAHPQFSMVGKVESKPFRFDPRMQKG